MAILYKINNLTMYKKMRHFMFASVKSVGGKSVNMK